MNKQHDLFDYTVLACIALVELICWIINRFLLTPQQEQEQVQPVIDLELCTVKQLKVMAKDAGLSFKSSIRKAQLLTLLAA